MQQAQKKLFNFYFIFSTKIINVISQAKTHEITKKYKYACLSNEFGMKFHQIQKFSIWCITLQDILTLKFFQNLYNVVILIIFERMF